jgi:signal peptidase II
LVCFGLVDDILLSATLPETPNSLADAQASAATEPRAPFGFLAVISALALAADVLTKLWAERTLAQPDSLRVNVLHGYLDLVLRHNPGGAFSFLETAPESLRRPFFVVVSVAAIGLVVFAYRRLRARDIASRWGFALVLGGALGNLADRVRGTGVVDFIRAHAAWGGQDHEWPVFNVADVAIVAGVALLVIGTLRRRRTV